jgi:hypothetical protein
MEVAMYQAFEATIDDSGTIRLSEPARLPAGRRVLVVLMDDAPVFNETYLLSQGSLAEAWNRPEEDAAWAYLQSEK